MRPRGYWLVGLVGSGRTRKWRNVDIGASQGSSPLAPHLQPRLISTFDQALQLSKADHKDAVTGCSPCRPSSLRGWLPAHTSIDHTSAVAPAAAATAAIEVRLVHEGGAGAEAAVGKLLHAPPEQAA